MTSHQEEKSYRRFGDTTKSVDEARPWQEPDTGKECRQACSENLAVCMAGYGGDFAQWKYCDRAMHACLKQPECKK